MLNKLAFRNAKRSIRDYLMYLITMTLMSAMMFAFNSMIFSEDILKMCSEAGIMGGMIGMATFFIVLIVAWLINYMVRFMLEKRSREFGTYLLLGMKKKSISKLYMRENILLGILAFFMGILAGTFLQQVLMTVFYHVFSENYKLHIEFNKWCLLMTVCCYMLCYMIALFRNKRLFKKMNIADFINMSKENEQVKEGGAIIRQWLFFAAIAYFIFFDIMLFYGTYTIWGVALISIGFLIAVYALYYGLSAFLVRFVQKGKKGLYKKNHLFLLRQYISKLKTMRFTMGTLTVLFTCALLGGSIAMMFANFQEQALNNSITFDVLVYSPKSSDHFEEEQKIIADKCKIKDSLVYQIYQNGSCDMNRYLYTHAAAISKKYQNDDGSLNEEEVKKDGYEYYDFDTFMGLSDYNHLRKMLGYEEISLDESRYAIQIKERMKNDLNYEIKNRKIDAGGRELSLSQIYTDPFSQNGNNGADYLIIVPDSALQTMNPYFSDLAVNVDGELPAELQELIENIHRKKNGMMPEKEFYQAQEEGRIDENEVWEDTSFGGCGTDQIIALISDVIVKSSLGAELRFVMTSVTFPLVYIGLVFLCVALTIMSVQQLSDSSKYRFRYQVLHKLGLCKGEIDRVIFKQLFAFYIVPVLTAVLLSSVIAVFAGNRFVFYTGAVGNGIYYFGISLVVFTGVYLLYFFVTYLGFKKNVGICE